MNHDVEEARHDAVPPVPQLEPVPEDRSLPFSKLVPFLVGMAAGIALRLVFSGKAGDAFAPMMGAFIFFAPLLVAAVTVYVAERQWRRSATYYFVAPCVANVLFVAGTLLINVEGWICALLIVPLFAVLGGIGGLIMGAICRLTKWPKQATYCFAVLPILLGAFEARLPLPERFGDLQRTLSIDAPPAVVWQQILRADQIRPDEVDSGWIYRIGVPLPQAGVIQDTPDGRVRRITMGKGIHFDQIVTAWQPQRYVHFDYRFAPDSFPPRALDDHVRIGGMYFDLRDTSYALAPHGDGTALTIRMRYRVSTSFNWYARPIAQWLIGDFEDTILQFYRHRSEAAARDGVMPTVADAAAAIAPPTRR